MSDTNSSSTNTNTDEYNTVLLSIYSVVLFSGTISLSLIMRIMKSSSTSITSIAVLNLIFTHFIFLLTVPFRIYYYATSNWNLGFGWCKVVSSMIHIHMYMSFIFYVIILITRLMMFYHKPEQEASFQRIHAFLISAVVWMVVLVVFPCIIILSYGKNIENSGTNNSTNNNKCFHFGKNIKNQSIAIVFNYIISTVIIVVAIVLTALQANVLRVLYRKHHQGCTSQQDFGAQLKSLCFALIMVICFIPYHLFRLHYLEHVEDLQSANEVFLSLTTFNCLDMLTFLGRRTCYMCFPRKPI
ncbi:probable G-protein coupled receptor 141 [Morone saxatilis]|uniref:probable G-protein coupled receptor 141 n=1 Tax=Morone saxatilis TaxID=34816 RepID=UPI0015E2507A|nr:probable G-protein coupled receptor 141 [Morone saxatilis]